MDTRSGGIGRAGWRVLARVWTGAARRFRVCTPWLVSVLAAADPAAVPALRSAHRDSPDWMLIEAEDAKACRLAGDTAVIGYPPQRVVILKPDAALTLACDAATVSLRLPMEFTMPGPGYGLSCDAAARLRASIDGEVVNEFTPYRMPREFTLADHLSAGVHTIMLQAVGGPLAIDGFRLSPRPLSRVQGLITGDGATTESLVDVRADVYATEGLVRSEIVRTPHDGGSFVLVGLAEGTYRMRFLAAGWEPLEIPSVRVAGPGSVVDLGVLVLRRDTWARALSWYGDAPPHYGRTINVSPGESFRTRVFLTGGTVSAARLRNRLKTVPVTVTEVNRENYGRWNSVALATFTVPPETPQDMYALEIGHWLLVQAVCVREPLPEHFFLAGISHFHVWGQRRSERIRDIAEMVQLAGARAFLMANEVNPAYLSGALMDLRIPYAVCRGNHVMSRWSHFFGAGAVASDDGPMRIVSFGGFPYESWAEPRELFQARPDATCRVLLCYEGFPPIELIRREAVDVLFDGHSDDPHPAAAEFPAGTLKLRTPGGLSLRWISMTHAGLEPSVTSAAEVPLLGLPADGPLPLRVEWLSPNDGTAERNTARIINDTTQPFAAARLRFVMSAGTYAVDGAELRQAFTADDGRRVLDVQVVVPARGEASAVCRPTDG